MKYIPCYIVALILSVNTFGGSTDSIVRIKPYHINYPVVGSIIGVGMVLDAFAIRRLKNKATITDDELLFANTDEQKNLISPIDRWALRQKASDRDLYTKVSDYGQVGVFLLPAFLTFDKNIRKDWFDLLLMYVEGHTITFSFYNYSFLGPTFNNKYRPLVYYPEFENGVRENSNNRNSFYSGHVASCAYSTFFMAKVYCDYHPDLGAAKYLLYLAAMVPPSVIAYARIKALAHFPSDDLVGMGLGAVIGIVVPELHKFRQNKHLTLGMFNSPEGMGLSFRWKFPDRRAIAQDN